VTASLSAIEVGKRINDQVPGAVSWADDSAITANSSLLLETMAFLKNTPGLDFNYLSTITAVDYYQYFEVVYLLVSLDHNHSIVIKTTCPREKPSIPSVVSLWRGADLQEREIFDLMGITFDGHPNMKRIVLWPEFKGHPLRKDYL